MSNEPRTETISVPCTHRELVIIRMAATACGETVEEFALSAALWRARAEANGARVNPGKEV